MDSISKLDCRFDFFFFFEQPFRCDGNWFSSDSFFRFFVQCLLLLTFFLFHFFFFFFHFEVSVGRVRQHFQWFELLII